MAFLMDFGSQSAAIPHACPRPPDIARRSTSRHNPGIGGQEIRSRWDILPGSVVGNREQLVRDPDESFSMCRTNFRTKNCCFLRTDPDELYNGKSSARQRYLLIPNDRRFRFVFVRARKEMTKHRPSHKMRRLTKSSALLDKGRCGMLLKLCRSITAS